MRRLLVFLIFLSGCKVGPNYCPPCLDIPSSYRFEPEDASRAVNAPWWKQFGDPVLVGLIEQALRYNDDIKIAAANIEQAIGILMQTRSSLFPQLGYSGSATRERASGINAPLPGTGVENPSNLYEINGTASWNIDFWGRIRRQVESSRADLFATVQARQNVILSVVASVANTYLQLRGLDQQLVIAKETLKSYEEALQYFETQYSYGQTSKMTVAQAATQYEMAAVAIPKLELQIVQTENALSILLGTNPGDIARGKTINAVTLPAVPAGIPSEILRSRPDILQREQELIAANASIGAAQALYFPDISLTGMFGNESLELSDLFKGPSKTWNYTGSVIGPIFTFGAIRGGVIQAQGARDAALGGYELAIKNAFAEVENALASRRYFAAQLDAQGKLVDAAKEYAHLANLQYEGGYSPYFVVLQAQEQLFPAELEWVQIRVSLLSSLVGVYQTMGGGWVIDAEKMTLPTAFLDIEKNNFTR